jgi:tRNA(Ile)-lysidine synthase
MDVGRLPANLAARFRAVRLEHFRRVCAGNALGGVILAHHADDQAETIFQRLLKGSAAAGLTGMRANCLVGGVRVLRPLLGVPSSALRQWLAGRGQRWREDSSNASAVYQRNRVREVLRDNPGLSVAMSEMVEAMRGLVEWARDAAPVLGESFGVADLGDLPDVLAVEAARRWLADRGALADELSPGVLRRLIEMARDAAAPVRLHFPGGVAVKRSGRRISVS